MVEPANQLVEHFFRHESGRLVAVLARIFGLRNLDLVEDTVQAALLEALQSWKIKGVPDNPSAWIHTVARGKILDALRHRETVLRLAPSYARLRPDCSEPELDDLFLDSAIADSQLRMVFACCHPSLSRENQIALALKALCGFSNAEIARGLLATEETIKKRLQRAKQELVANGVDLAVPAAGELATRLDSVHQCLYLLFNEGYAATSGDVAIRGDLCAEAVRLCDLLCSQPQCRGPASFALLALMLFHASRFEARTGADGRLLLLEDQDRSKWDADLIKRATYYLNRSAEGERISAYHLEAGIALLHCSAASFAETDWPAILRLYDVLVRVAPSPIVNLNRAIVVAHIEGPAAGITLIEQFAGSLKDYHLVEAALGELHRRAGNAAKARDHFMKAIQLAQSDPDRALLQRRLDACLV
jgi:RNA polymerase sigma factor (sigma-70 family)